VLGGDVDLNGSALVDITSDIMFFWNKRNNVNINKHINMKSWHEICDILFNCYTLYILKI